MSEGARARAVAVVAGLLCSSCLMVGPDYKPPDSALPAAWTAPVGEGGTSIADPLQDWWKNLGDPLLDDLVVRAITTNTDVRRAVAQVRAARAARQGTVAALFPSLNSNAEYQRRRISGAATGTSSPEFGEYAAGFDASWEIDLFGGLRRSTEQATAELEAITDDLRGVLVSLLAEVARNYVELRSLQARIAIAEGNARSQQETLDIVRWRYQAGLTGALDVDQAEYNLAQTRARVPSLVTERVAAANRIGVLLGQNAGSLDTELAPMKPVPTVPATIAVGLPVDLVRRRPDIAAAERRLGAATAAIGVATANLYPKLSLSGTFAVSATDFANLDAASARAFSVGPTLSWNVFDAGRIRSVIEQNSAEADAALAVWEAAVLAACEEAENALVAYVQEQRRRDLLAEAREAARRSQNLARLQYENGLVDFQQVLEADRAVLGFEESFAISQAAVVTDLVALSKALGGGWETVKCGDEGCR